jgi:hypothetical protein
MKLTDISTHELEAELERRKKNEARVEYDKRARLAWFIRDNREAFIEFFELAGCKYPVDAVSCLSDNWGNFVPHADVVCCHITTKYPGFEIPTRKNDE